MDWEQVVREMWASERFTVEQVLTAVCHFCDEIGSPPICDKVPGEFVELAGMVRFLADSAAVKAEQECAEVERLRGELEQARAEERERCIEVVRTAPVESAVHVRDDLALAIDYLKYRP